MSAKHAPMVVRKVANDFGVPSVTLEQGHKTYTVVVGRSMVSAVCHYESATRMGRGLSFVGREVKEGSPLFLRLEAEARAAIAKAAGGAS